MANMALNAAVGFFDATGFKYSRLEKDPNGLEAYYNMDNRDRLRVLIFFDEDGEAAKVCSWNVVDFPADKKEKMYAVCNELNAQYRWVKFYVDEKDNSVTAEYDMDIDLDTCGKRVRSNCATLASIVDKSYPTMMKAIWA